MILLPFMVLRRAGLTRPYVLILGDGVVHRMELNQQRWTLDAWTGCSNAGAEAEHSNSHSASGHGAPSAWT